MTFEANVSINLGIENFLLILYNLRIFILITNKYYFGLYYTRKLTF